MGLGSTLAPLLSNCLTSAKSFGSFPSSAFWSVNKAPVRATLRVQGEKGDECLPSHAPELAFLLSGPAAPHLGSVWREAKFA